MTSIQKRYRCDGKLWPTACQEGAVQNRHQRGAPNDLLDIEKAQKGFPSVWVFGDLMMWGYKGWVVLYFRRRYNGNASAATTWHGQWWKPVHLWWHLWTIVLLGYLCRPHQHFSMSTPILTWCIGVLFSELILTIIKSLILWHWSWKFWVLTNYDDWSIQFTHKAINALWGRCKIRSKVVNFD